MNRILIILLFCILFSINSKAQIIYTDIPDTQFPCNIDIDNDSINDYFFSATSTYCLYWGTHEYILVNRSLIRGSQNFNYNIVPANSGEIISENYHFSSWTSASSDLCYSCVGNGFWPSAYNTFYLPLDFIKNNQLFYGWAAIKPINQSSSCRFYLTSYAYNSIAFGSIVVGQTNGISDESLKVGLSNFYLDNNILNIVINQILNKQIDITIVNLVGSTLLRYQIISTTSNFSLQCLGSGMYFVIISIDGVRIVKKIEILKN